MDFKFTAYSLNKTNDTSFNDTLQFIKKDNKVDEGTGLPLIAKTLKRFRWKLIFHMLLQMRENLKRACGMHGLLLKMIKL